jgi:hypothetical protein
VPLLFSLKPVVNNDYIISKLLENQKRKITPYLWQRRGGEGENCQRYAWRD